MNLKSFLKPSWLIIYEEEKMLKKMFSKYLTGKLVDIGCGTKPFSDLTKPYVTEYIGVDHELTKHDKNSIDIFATAYDIPVADESFDSVLCTSVLEHLEDPSKAFCEINRILRKNGKAILTIPFVHHLHEEPRDFFRFSKYGIEYLAQKNNLEISEIHTRGGFFITFATELAYCIDNITQIKILKPFKVIVFNIFLSIAFLLSFVDPSKQFLPGGYIVVLQKMDKKTISS